MTSVWYGCVYEVAVAQVTEREDRKGRGGVGAFKNKVEEWPTLRS